MQQFVIVLILLLSTSRSFSQERDKQNDDCAAVLITRPSFDTAQIKSTIKKLSGTEVIDDTLRYLYPAAAKYWNEGIELIKSSYSKNWKQFPRKEGYNVESSTFVVRKQDMPDSHYFFVYLMKLQYPGYFAPSNPWYPQIIDTDLQLAIAQQTDVDGLLNSIVAGLQSACKNLTDAEIRKRIQLKKLPESIDDCLK